MNFLIKKYNRFKEIGLSETIFFLKYRIKYAYKMKFGYFVHKKAKLENRKLIEIKKYAEIQEYVIIKTFRNSVKIGKFTQINPFTVIYGGNGVIIGDNVMIAPHCMIASGNHDYKQLDIPMRHAGDLSKGPILIEDGVWIGANSTIVDGVTVGHNSVVSANSVVIKNVAPFDIVGGVPAKVISNRIDASLGRKLSSEERLIYIESYKKKYENFKQT